MLICNLIYFPEMVTCSYIGYVRGLSMFMLWAEKMYSFPCLLLESRQNPRREGGLRKRLSSQ